MGFMRVVLICFAPLLSMLAMMGAALLSERYGTGKNLMNSRLLWGAVIVLTIVLTGFYLLKTPLGSPIFEILSDGQGGGSLVIFSGSMGMPLPLALISILGLLLMCIATAAGSSLTIVLLADTVIGLAFKAFKR